jgi:hypothetical protein
VLDPIQGLGDPHRRGGVDHDIHASQRGVAGASVADIPHPEFGLGREIRTRAVRVRLGIQRVEHAHGVTGGQEAVDQKRPDEPRAPGHQHAHRSKGGQADSSTHGQRRRLARTAKHAATLCQIT